MPIRFCVKRSSSIADIPNGSSSARTSEQGFTLLELLVALTLAAVISLCISTVGTQAQRIYDTTTAKVEVYQKFRYALDDMEKTLRGWVPTTSLEFFVDQSQQSATVSGKNGHWDEGEEIGIKGPNLDGGVYGEYDEGAKIFERKYRLVKGPYETTHDAYSIYFRGPVEIDGVIKQANVEYMLADPRNIRGDRVEPIDPEVDDNTNFVLLKVIRYLDVNGENYNRSTTEVKQVIREICPNVTDLRIEYFYDNIFDSREGTFVTPSTERDLVQSENPPKETDRNVDGWVKEFLYGGFRDFVKGTGIRGRRDVTTGVDEPTYFDASVGSTDIRFSQLGLGDEIYIWNEGNSDWPPGTYTIRRNQNGRLFFDESIDSADWDSANQPGLRFRAAFLPSSLRISVRVLNDEGMEPRTLTIIVHPYAASL